MQTNQPKTSDKNPKKNTAIFFEIDRFIPRILRNWALYLFSLIFAVFLAIYINNYYLDRVYQAETTFHVSTKSSGNTDFGSNSINFIWGGTGGKIDILTKVLQSRTHSFEVAKKIQAYIAYKEEGTFKKSNTHRNISPFIVEIDTTHNQFLGVELEIKKVDDKSFNIIPLTSISSNQLYNYAKDSTITKNVNLKLPTSGKFNQWIEGEHFRF